MAEYALIRVRTASFAVRLGQGLCAVEGHVVDEHI